MENSYEQFDKPYRRGLVLGFSLAELFLILLFLLLLVTMGISALLYEEQEKVKYVEKENGELRDNLKEIKEILGDEIDYDDLQNLIEGKKELEEEKNELSDSLINSEKEKTDLTERLEQFKDLEEILKEEEITPKDVENLITEKGDLAELTSEVAELKNENKTITEQLAQKDIETSELEFALEGLGRNPPCRYRPVPKKGGGTRPGDVKVYDVKMTDKGFLVRRYDSSKVKEINKGDESVLSEIKNSAFNKNISINEFLKTFQPIKDAGENNKVRGYKCKFMVHLYDSTSKKYKESLRAVQTIFYTYPIESKWPGN